MIADRAPAGPAPSLHVPDGPAIAGLRFRAYAGVADHAAMVDVCNAARTSNGDPEVGTLESIGVDYTHMVNCDPARDMILAEVDGRLVAYGRTFWEDMNDGVRGHHSFGFVHPDWRRRGIGRAMLRHLERRNLANGEGHPPDLPRALISWGYDQDAGNVALLISEGYTVDRRFVHMVRPTLDEIEVPPLPAGLDVRPATDDQLHAIFLANAEAFRDHWGGVDTSDTAFERWREQPDTDPSLFIVAWAGDEVAGSVLGLISEEENLAHGYLRGWLDSVSVRRPWRRRGLAAALIGRALERLRERGMTSAQLGVDVDNGNQALDLYQRAGFIVDREEKAWRKPWPTPVPALDDESALAGWHTG